MKVATAAKMFKVDRMTLTQFMKANQRGDKATGYAALAASKMMFTAEMEEDLANHIKTLANMFHGLTRKKCRMPAFKFAKANHLSIHVSWEKNCEAGRDWWISFKKRNKLTIRSPEATSIA